MFREAIHPFQRVSQDQIHEQGLFLGDDRSRAPLTRDFVNVYLSLIFQPSPLPTFASPYVRFQARQAHPIRPS